MARAHATRVAVACSPGAVRKPIPRVKRAGCCVWTDAKPNAKTTTQQHLKHAWTGQMTWKRRLPVWETDAGTRMTI